MKLGMAKKVVAAWSAAVVATAASALYPDRNEQSKYVREKGLLGLLMTTWHQIPLSALHYFENGARASWEMHDGKPLALLNPHVAAHHMRVVGWDVPNRGYRDTGWWKRQLPFEVTR